MLGKKNDRTAQDPGTADKAATAIARRLIDLGIRGAGPLRPAAAEAEHARVGAKHTEDAVDALIETHLRLVAAGGFVTGLGGLVTMPVALPANVIEFYILATRMVAGIAHLRGYDLSRDEVRSAVLLALIGSDAKLALVKAGLPGGLLGRVATRQLPGPALMLVNKAVGFRVMAQVGEKSVGRVLGRAVPLAGGVIGAGADWYLLRQIARHARSEFPLAALPGPVHA